MILTRLKPIQPIIIFIIANITILPISVFFLQQSLFKSFIDYERKIMLSDLKHIESRILPNFTYEKMAQLEPIIRTAGTTSNSRITLIDTSGNVILDSQRDAKGMDNHADRPEVFEAISSGLGFSHRYSRTMNRYMVYTAKTTLLSDGEKIVIRLSKPTISPEDVLSQNLSHSIKAGGIIVILNIALLMFMAYVFKERTKRLLQSVVGVLKEKRLPDIELVDAPEYRKILGDVNYISERIHSLESNLENLTLLIESFTKTKLTSVVITDLEGRILNYNQGLKLLFPERADKLFGVHLAEIIRSERLVEMLKAVRDTHNPESGSFELDIKGESVPVKISIAPVSIKNTYIDGFMIEFSDQREVENLKNISDEFLTNVSHELRTPLTAIKGFVETLKEDEFDDEATSRRFLGIIDLQVQRLVETINAILFLTRLEARLHEYQMELVPHDLLKTLEEVRDTCEPLAREKGILLGIVGERGSEALVNPVLIRQAIMNLVDNAIKFSPQGSEVEIGLKAEDGITVWVKDQGPGIKKGEESRIFERFYKTDPSRGSKGAGLGLSIVRAIVELHKGSVELISNGSKGSLFKLRLPSRKKD